MDPQSPSLETLRAQYKAEAEPTPYGSEVWVGAGIILLGTAGCAAAVRFLLVEGDAALALLIGGHSGVNRYSHGRGVLLRQWLIRCDGH